MAWPFNQLVPINKDDLHQAAADILASFQPESIEIKPQRMSVQAYGDIGIVYHEITLTAVTKAGADITFHRKMTHTWLRTENGWKINGVVQAVTPAIDDKANRTSLQQR